MSIPVDSTRKAILAAWNGESITPRPKSTFPAPKLLLARSGGETYLVIDDSQSVITMMSSSERGEQTFATTRSNCTVVDSAYVCQHLAVTSCETKSAYSPKELYALKYVVQYI